MKLNHDCIRAILLYLEDVLTINNYFRISPDDFENTTYITNFQNIDVIYSCQKLIEAGYINGSCQKFLDKQFPEITITSITWEGHKFLDNIRDDNVWKKTKGILSKFTSTSIGIISDISAQVISNLISKQLNLL